MRSETPRRLHSPWARVMLLLAGIAILAMVYMFQRYNPWVGFEDTHPNVIFAINRTTRLIFNDLACFLIIFAVFQETKYLKVAFWVFLLELMVILPLYLLVKLSLEGDSEISSPLLSQIHRLIVNPMLMILLMGGFFYQRYFRK
jgi:exosortase F-associated protein